MPTDEAVLGRIVCWSNFHVSWHVKLLIFYAISTFMQSNMD